MFLNWDFFNNYSYFIDEQIDDSYSFNISYNSTAVFSPFIG